jgi:hypothetical protein
MACLTLREAEPRGLGLAPENIVFAKSTVARKKYRITFFFFQKKKQKALFCFAEDHGLSNPPRSGATGSGAGPRKYFLLNLWGRPQKNNKGLRKTGV